jgi:hypothetical protein
MRSPLVICRRREVETHWKRVGLARHPMASDFDLQAVRFKRAAAPF